MVVVSRQNQVRIFQTPTLCVGCWGDVEQDIQNTDMPVLRPPREERGRSTRPEGRAFVRCRVNMAVKVGK